MSSDEALNPGEYLIARQVALLLNCSDSLIHNLRETGKLPFINEPITGRPVYRRADVLAYRDQRDAERADRDQRDAQILKHHKAGLLPPRIARLVDCDPCTVRSVIAKAARS